MDELVFVSLQAPSADDLWQAVIAQLDVPMRIVDDVPWQTRERMLQHGEAHVGVVCGLQYIHASGLELVAAPVMRGPRYQNRPVYFSDVVVRPDSAVRSLADLRGATWAVNEPTSHSGFNITRAVLAARGEGSAFFGRVIESGAHQHSLALLRAGAIDATAIDSTVLDTLRPDVRVIETFGPSPIPPVVVSRTVPIQIRRALVAEFARVQVDPIARFVPVVDADYDLIREMARLADRLPAWTLQRLARSRLVKSTGVDSLDTQSP